MRKVLLGLIFISILATSCSKKEVPYVLPPKGEAVSETLHMGQDYNFQFYYNLASKQVVHISDIRLWDIKFESGFDGKQVFINGGVGMAVKKTGMSEFYEVSEQNMPDTPWLIDDASGSENSSCFGDWTNSTLSKEEVYIIRLNNTGTDLRKLKLISVTNFGYMIEVASINASIGNQFFIEKDANSNFTYFDLALLKKVPNMEPLPEVWDVLFTRYGYTFYDQNPPLPYPVTGVLLNPMSTFAHKDSLLDFYSINETILPKIEFAKNQDAIGFDWKVYDIEQAVYQVRQDYSYIIKTKQEDVFKLRFNSFYSDNGLKGSPSFEFAQIQ